MNERKCFWNSFQNAWGFKTGIYYISGSYVTLGPRKSQSIKVIVFSRISNTKMILIHMLHARSCSVVPCLFLEDTVITVVSCWVSAIVLWSWRENCHSTLLGVFVKLSTNRKMEKPPYYASMLSLTRTKIVLREL